MRFSFLFVPLLWCNFILAQNSTLQPPENVKIAFEKQYPKKNPIWSLEFGNNDIRFIANFIQSVNIKVIAVYDNDGLLKAYKVPLSLQKLPQMTKKYLEKNYGRSVKDILSVLDENNVETYEVGVMKDKKKYILVFDKNGAIINRIQIV